ncbi:hypothetical protein ColLi_08661 [Colletotrichum liriopes]|uniref:Uncharacterized protein n=1 Tax=Colletotrichum liriopes TaxID=708192 RepID=A0AA37GTF1_9PEZI|nr:hypothetical protein ColLi_08661 [Colletotrichum liriopes]
MTSAFATPRQEEDDPFGIQAHGRYRAPRRGGSPAQRKHVCLKRPAPKDVCSGYTTGATGR